jgi:hypothetical protein
LGRRIVALSFEVEVDRFTASLQEVTRSLAKRHFWGLRESITKRSDSSRKVALIRVAANEVARLAEPSPRIDLNGHSASSLLRAIAEAGDVAPPTFEGIQGRGLDGSLIAISPFEPREMLFAIAYQKDGQGTTFVHGYFYRNAQQLLRSLTLRHAPASASYMRMAQFVAQAEGAALDRPMRSWPAWACRRPAWLHPTGSEVDGLGHHARVLFGKTPRKGFFRGEAARRWQPSGRDCWSCKPTGYRSKWTFRLASCVMLRSSIAPSEII